MYSTTNKRDKIKTKKQNQNQNYGGMNHVDKKRIRNEGTGIKKFKSYERRA